MKTYDLRVADLMSTALITVTESERVTDAHAEMESGVIRHLPVVDHRGHLVGVLSDRDVLRAAAAKSPPRVAEIMTRDVVTIGPDAPAHQAAAVMLDLKISSLLVIDDADTLIGVVTQTDFVDLARRALLGLPLER